MKKITLIFMALLLLSCSVSKSQITFAPYTTTATGSWPEVVAIHDMNSDGQNDIVLGLGTYSSPNDYTIKIGKDSAGSFVVRKTLHYPHVYPGLRTMEVGDLNNNNLSDIVIGYDDSIRVFFQVFPDSFVFVSYYSGNTVDGVALGDLNHDGLQDIAVSHWNDSFIRVFLQTSLGNFSQTTYPVPQAGYDELEIGDLNNDGLDDVVFMRGQLLGNHIYIFYQTAGGILAPPVVIANPLGSSTLPNSIDIGDLNGDGKNDIASSWGGNMPGSKLVTFIQDTNGIFIATIYNTYQCPATVKIHDMDCDGKNEIMILHGGWLKLSVHKPTDNYDYTGYTLTSLPSADYYNPHGGMDIGDITGDLSPDIVIANYNYGIVFLKNTTPPTVTVDTVIGVTITTSAVPISTSDTTLIWYVYAGDTTFTYTNTITSVISEITETTDSTLSLITHVMSCSVDSSSTVSYVIATTNTKYQVTHTISYIEIDTTYTITEVMESSAPLDILIYPNPATDYINITIDPTSRYEVMIMDMSGKVMLSQIYQGRIDVSDFSKGMYMVCIKKEEGYAVQKLIIQ